MSLEPGQILQAGGVRLETRFVPGHALGHVVFVGGGLVIAGDTLFRESIGRTDLPGGDLELLLGGIRSQILTLPDETVIECHGVVQWAKKVPPALSRLVKKNGMGIAFLEIPLPYKALIEMLKLD